MDGCDEFVKRETLLPAEAVTIGIDSFLVGFEGWLVDDFMYRGDYHRSAALSDLFETSKFLHRDRSSLDCHPQFPGCYLK